MRAITEGYNAFVGSLIPRTGETAKAASSLRVTERCLKSNYGMTRHVACGSACHGTDVNGFSAADGLAVLDKTRLYESPDKSMVEIRDCLAEHFPEASITERGASIAIPFGKTRSQRHHVVPAFPAIAQGPHEVFAIPGPADRWIETCPGGHAALIADLDGDAEGKFRPFVCVVKAWNYFNGEPLGSFYLELRAASFLNDNNPVIFSFDVAHFLSGLARDNLAPAEQPVSCKEAVQATSTSNRKFALHAVRTAAETARSARDCEIKGDLADAFYYWRKLFKWRFPVQASQDRQEA